MAKYISIVVGAFVFIAWIALVGNPHVVETVIGLVLASVSGGYVFYKMRRRAPAPK